MYTALRTAVLVFVLMGFVVALTACATYPVETGARASAPSASAPVLPNR
jgi:hypothetical protein